MQNELIEVTIRVTIDSRRKIFSPEDTIHDKLEWYRLDGEVSEL